MASPHDSPFGHIIPQPEWVPMPQVEPDFEICPVNFAASVGDLQALKHLCAAGNSVNIVDCLGKYPLHNAVLSNSENVVEVISFLLDAGADIDCRDGFGETPLTAACYWSTVDVIRLLSERTADINYSNAFTGRTAIHFAAMGKCWASQNEMSQDREPLGEEDAVSVLLRHGADPNICNWDEETPLIIATRSNCLPVVKALLETDCILDHQDSRGYTALHWSAYCNHLEVTRLLIEGGASLNIKQGVCTELTPLHVAAKHGNTACLELLLTGGALVEETDSCGLNVLARAVEARNSQCVRLLLCANADAQSAHLSESLSSESAAYLLSDEHDKLISSTAVFDIAADLAFAGSRFQWFWDSAASKDGTCMIFQKCVCQMYTLQHLCRLCIRNSLSRGLRAVTKDIDALNLPKSIKEYLLFKSILNGTHG